jgi:hypothetical protein
METVMGEDKKVKKVGMKDQQREGWEYELTVSLNIERDTHMAIPSKDRTNLFEGKNPFLITEATGEAIKNWCETGAVEKAADVKLKEATTLAELANTFKSLSAAEQKQYSKLTNELKAAFDPEKPELKTVAA